MPEPEGKPREVKACPYCGEEILAVAVKCKHCGEFLNKVPAGQAAPDPAAPLREAAGQDEPRQGVAEEEVIFQGSGSQWTNFSRHAIYAGLLLLGMEIP